MITTTRAVGAMVLSDLDLVACLETGAPLDGPDPGTLCGGDGRGHTDYPAPPRTVGADARAA